MPLLILKESTLCAVLKASTAWGGSSTKARDRRREARARQEVMAERWFGCHLVVESFPAIVLDRLGCEACSLIVVCCGLGVWRVWN